MRVHSTLSTASEAKLSLKAALCASDICSTSSRNLEVIEAELYLRAAEHRPFLSGICTYCIQPPSTSMVSCMLLRLE